MKHPAPAAMSDSPHWYAMDDLPSGRVHVRIRARRGGYRLAAAAAPDKMGILRWFEVSDRHLRPLRWRPEAWQPLDAETWSWPLGTQPEPLPVEVLPRMAMIGGVPQEIPEDDVAAGADEGVRVGQWWRDASLLRYEAAGAVTRVMAEGRLMRALSLERMIRMDMAPYRSNGAVLADIKRTLADVLAEEPDEDWAPRLRPVAADWSDFEIVMGWITDVWPSRRALAVMRARMRTPPATWTQIGDVHRMSATHAKRIYNRVVDLATDAANATCPTRRHKMLADLREQNRAARRDGGGA